MFVYKQVDCCGTCFWFLYRQYLAVFQFIFVDTHSLWTKNRGSAIYPVIKYRKITHTTTHKIQEVWGLQRISVWSLFLLCLHVCEWEPIYSKSHVLPATQDAAAASKQKLHNSVCMCVLYECMWVFDCLFSQNSGSLWSLLIPIPSVLIPWPLRLDVPLGQEWSNLISNPFFSLFVHGQPTKRVSAIMFA